MFLPLTVATSDALYGVNSEVSILPFSVIYFASGSESVLPSAASEAATDSSALEKLSATDVPSTDETPLFYSRQKLKI